MQIILGCGSIILFYFIALFLSICLRKHPWYQNAVVHVCSEFVLCNSYTVIDPDDNVYSNLTCYAYCFSHGYPDGTYTQIWWVVDLVGLENVQRNPRLYPDDKDYEEEQDGDENCICCDEVADIVLNLN